MIGRYRFQLTFFAIKYFKIKYTIIVLWALVTMCILGCSYQFSDDHYINLQKASADDISISLDFFNEGDTINVERIFSYTISKGPNQYGISTEILVDNQKIASSSNTDSGEFRLRPSRYPDGEHIIRIVHVLSSGTGSISEQSQMETLTAIEDFRFVIKRKPSPPPAIASATIENGSITVRWENEGNPEFINAYLSLQFPDYERRIELTEEMLAQGSYIDSYTVLFPLDSNRSEDEDRSTVTYSIVLESAYEESYGEGATISHDPAWIDVSMSFVDLDRFLVSWPQHPLYANFDSYSIAIRKDSFYDAHIISASTQGGTEIVAAPYSFGADYYGSLSPETNYDPYISPYKFRPRLDETSFLPISYMIQNDGGDFIFNPSTQRYYLLAKHLSSVNNIGISIFEYNADMEYLSRTLLLEPNAYSNDVKFTMVMHPQSNNFYVDIEYRTPDLRLFDVTMEIDKNNLNKLREFTVEGQSGSQSLQLRGNILKSWDYKTKIVSLTNVETNEVFYSVEAVGSRSTRISYLSRDGKYLYLNLPDETAIYLIENNTATKRLDLAETPGFGVMSVDIYEDKLHYFTGNQDIISVDLLTNQTTTIGSFVAGNNSTAISYDPISNKILGTQYEVCFITDLSTGETTQFSYESEKGYSQLGGDYRLWLTNNKIVHSKGIYVDLP